MTSKQFKIIKMIVVVLLASAFSFTYATNNLILGLALLLIGTLTLLFFQKRVDEVMVDEMVYAIGGKAALTAIQIYCWLAVILMLFARSMKQANPLVFSLTANVLAFSTCVLMLIYSATYYFFAKTSWKDPKFIFATILALIFIAFFVVGIFMNLL